VAADLGGPALYRDAGLVVADEPTAALDAKAEHAVFTTLRGLPNTGDPHNGDGARGAGTPEGHSGRGRITVLITHRLANVRHADHIIVLDHGRVAAQGGHDELLRTPGVYRDLFTLQARAYQSGKRCATCDTATNSGTLT